MKREERLDRLFLAYVKGTPQQLREVMDRNYREQIAEAQAKDYREIRR